MPLPWRRSGLVTGPGPLIGPAAAPSVPEPVHAPGALGWPAEVAALAVVTEPPEGSVVVATFDPPPQTPRSEPCYVCGAPTYPWPFDYATVPGFAICPPDENLACLDRAKARRDAEQAAERAAQTAPGDGEEQPGTGEPSEVTEDGGDAADAGETGASEHEEQPPTPDGGEEAAAGAGDSGEGEPVPAAPEEDTGQSAEAQDGGEQA